MQVPNTNYCGACGYLRDCCKCSANYEDTADLTRSKSNVMTLLEFEQACNDLVTLVAKSDCLVLDMKRGHNFAENEANFSIKIRLNNVKPCLVVEDKKE